ncbi:MAG: pyrophosphokinae/guanosine-3,5-bis (diphosphate) 3-pyrophosphohydrolase [Bacillales bacterium]|jgi:GTP pyrophosphokinase|nr:pyrophosphokinae/guanosine-3,5-bis (diphosphate) 3-pyrophosphohydrolase [Bacillales bacterium]
MSQSRVAFLELCLSQNGFHKALEALDLMIEEMCAEKGYSRHDGTHYYYHLVDVTQILFNYGIRDEATLIGALLHDYAEDVPGVTIKMIEQRFGPVVAEAVRLVTKLDGKNYKDAETMSNYMAEILKSWRATLIKTADRMHNFSTLRDATPAKKMKQVGETETFFFPFFKDARNKYPRYAQFFYAAKTAIKPHLDEIREHYIEMEALQSKITILESKLQEAQRGVV